MWDGGSEPQFLTPLHLLPVAPVAPVAPAASSKNADLIAIRVTSELATSSDTFVLCAGCGLGEGRGAPVQARAPPEQLSTEKHICFEQLFLQILAVGQILSLYAVLESLGHPQKSTEFLPDPNPAQSAPGEPRELPRQPKALSEELESSPYMYKLPINRPSGRYVTILLSRCKVRE